MTSKPMVRIFSLTKDEEDYIVLLNNDMVVARFSEKDMEKVTNFIENLNAAVQKEIDKAYSQGSHGDRLNCEV